MRMLFATILLCENILIYFLLFFRENKTTFHVNHLPGRWFTWNVKSYFLWKIITWLRMSSATILFGVLRIKFISQKYHCIIAPPKNWKFSDKNSDIFQISAQNIDCGYSIELPQQGSSNEYPQSMFLSRNKRSTLYRHVFVMFFFFFAIRYKYFYHPIYLSTGVDRPHKTE